MKSCLSVHVAVHACVRVAGSQELAWSCVMSGFNKDWKLMETYGIDIYFGHISARNGTKMYFLEFDKFIHWPYLFCMLKIKTWKLFSKSTCVGKLVLLKPLLICYLPILDSQRKRFYEFTNISQLSISVHLKIEIEFLSNDWGQ